MVFVEHRTSYQNFWQEDSLVQDNSTLLPRLSWCTTNPTQLVFTLVLQFAAAYENIGIHHASCTIKRPTSSASGQKWKARPASQLSINCNPSSYTSEELNLNDSASPLCFQDT